MKNKGITLIALIITIIVLLILAGVTITTLSGENGLLNRAKMAKSKSESAQIDENTTLDEYSNTIDKHSIATSRGDTINDLNFENSEVILTQNYSMSENATITVQHTGWVVMEENPNGVSGIFYTIITGSGLKYAGGNTSWMSEYLSFPVSEGTTIEYRFWGSSYSNTKLTLLY